MCTCVKLLKAIGYRAFGQMITTQLYSAPRVVGCIWCRKVEFMNMYLLARGYCEATNYMVDRCFYL